MKGSLVFIFIILAGQISVCQAKGTPLVPEEGTDQACLRCHSQAMSWDTWTHSAHFKAGLSCTDCHKGADKAGHKAADVSKPQCTNCHYFWKGQADEFKKSVHAKQGFKCSACHNPHAETSMEPTDNKVFAAKCTRCHTGNIIKTHSFFPHARIHLTQHSCIVCHPGVHTSGGPDDNTLTCRNCHPNKEMAAKMLPKYWSRFPHPPLHLKKLQCEDCHRPKGPIKNCTECHSERSILKKAVASGWITNEDVRKKYGYIIGANHVKWLDILGILMFAGALGVWFFHGGLRILAGMLRKGRKK